MATPPDTVATAIRTWRSYTDPLVVALDGHGAAGKSTLAQALHGHLDVAVIHTDDFFRAASERENGALLNGHGMERYYDWERLREQALKPLRRGQSVSYRAFDERHDRFRDEPVTIDPADVIVVEGVSSACRELADLVDRTILVHTPQPIRLGRLHSTIAPDAWDDAWLAAELTYFGDLGGGYFDLIVSGS